MRYRFGVVLGDNQSSQVEGMIPFRSKGSFYQEPPEAEPLPARTRKFKGTMRGEVGTVDARRNWWGEAATAEMVERGGDANISAIDQKTIANGIDLFFIDKF